MNKINKLAVKSLKSIIGIIIKSHSMSKKDYMRLSTTIWDQVEKEYLKPPEL